MIRIYLIRHGQTDWNIQRRLQGHTDIPLNEKGKTQARKLKDVLATLEIDAFFSSDLIRAIETAELAKLNSEIPLIQEEKLREAALGEAEGLFFDELHLRFPDAYKRWLTAGDDNADFSFPGGESISEHRIRMKDALNILFGDHVEKNNFKTIAIVTHGGAMRRVLEMATNFKEKEFRTHNTSVFELHYDKKLKELKFIKKVYSPE